MNASYNDQQKQVNPVSSTCWDFGVLSKTSLKSGGLILKLASSLLTERHVFFTDFVCLSVCFSIRNTKYFQSILLLPAQNIGSIPSKLGSWLQILCQRIPFPYHLCVNTTFSTSEENFLQSKNGIKTMKTKETLNLHFNFPFSFLKKR